ncbi:hypothetical protein [Acidocella sp.]|uniref:hypothetical protein n=1 Tax=Acidocella sp. TaxID=50710 RepID=UPI003D07D502
MLADLAFETDHMGRFTSFGPGLVLGRPAADLMGTEMATLLAGGTSQDEALTSASFRSIITTICTECVAWHGRVRLSGAGEAPGTLYRLSLAPRFSAGSILGTYGLLFDLEAPELGLPDRHEGNGGGAWTSVLDTETGLWAAPAFANEISRRLDRLDVEGQPGTLIYLGFSLAAPELRKEVATRLAEELRDIVRPTDLLGRIDDSTIGLWCDGMDHLTGGERAARFCATLPSLLPGQTSIAVGVVPRWPGSGEDSTIIMEHGAVTLRLAAFACERQPADERNSTWKVWQTE